MAARVIVFHLLYLFLFCYTLASADTYYLSSTGSDDPTNNCQESSPCRSLEFVISSLPATPYSTIIFEAGTYTIDSPSSSIDVTNFALYSTNATIYCSDNYSSSGNPALSTTGGTTITGVSVYNCPVVALSASINSVLSIYNSAFGNNSNAVSAVYSQVFIQGCQFSTSTGSSSPAVQIAYSSLTIMGSDFSNSNNAPLSYPGSGLAVYQSSGLISDSTFSNNQAPAGTSALYIGGNSFVTLDSLEISNNEIVGLHAWNSTVTLSNSEITRCSGLTNGGGLFAEASDLTISYCNITYNFAQLGAGLYLTQGSLGTISYSDITLNDGGGIYLDDADFAINYGQVNDINIATDRSAETLRVTGTVLYATSTYGFCCAPNSVFDTITGSPEGYVCDYPACNPDQCAGANGCVCPPSVTETQVRNVTFDICNCTDGFMGPFCTQYNCTEDTCNGNGFCSSISKCSCEDDYYGDFCDTFCTSELSCSGNGNCTSNGTCTCNPGFEGANCAPLSTATTRGSTTRHLTTGSGTTGSSTSGSVNSTGFSSSTTGHIYYGSCKVSAQLIPRLYARWTVNNTFYQIFDILLTNSGPFTATDVVVQVANTSISQTWNLRNMSANGNGTWFSVNSLDSLPSATQYSAAGFVNRGAGIPAITSVSCNDTGSNYVANDCNGVKIDADIRTSYMDNLTINSVYGITVTNFGEVPVTDLQIQISGTYGTHIIDVVNLTQVSASDASVFQVPIGTQLDVSQSLTGFGFTLQDAGGVTVTCASSAVGTADKITKGGMSKRHRDGAIAGGVIGGVILIALLVALIIFLAKRRRRMVQVPSFERTGVHKKPRFGIEHFSDVYDNNNPSAADNNL